MWWTLSLAALLLAGPQEPAARPVDRAPVGTRAPATIDDLPDAIVKRIKAIEAKPKPKSRAWKMPRPGFDRVPEASMEMAARHHNEWADHLGLARQERAEFLAILKAGHEARLESTAYRLKQGSGASERAGRAFRARYPSGSTGVWTWR